MRYLAKVTNIGSWVEKELGLKIKSDRLDKWAECDDMELVERLEEMNDEAYNIKHFLM